MKRHSLARPCPVAATTLGLLLLLSPSGAHGQTQTVLGVPGPVRVRVEITDAFRRLPFVSPNQQVIADLVRESPDTLYLSIAGTTPIGVARTNVRSIRVSAGVSRARSASVQGVALGVLVGGLTFLVAGDDRGSRALNAAGVSAGIGAVLGAISPFETWRRVRYR